MAGLDLATCEAKLSEYLAAETAALSGKRTAITVDGTSRDITQHDLQWIQQGITLWNTRIQRLSRSGLAIREVIPYQ